MKSVLKQLLSKNYSVTSIQKYSSYNEPRLSYLSSTADEPLVPWTLGDVIDRAAAIYGDNEAVIVRHQNIRRNFEQLKADVDNLAAGFLALGLKKGERIGIWSPNNYEWILSYLSAAKAGLISVSVNAASQAREMEYYINKVDMKALVFLDIFRNQKYYEILKSMIPNITEARPGNLESERFPSLKHLISISNQKLEGTYTFEDITKAGGSTEIKAMTDLQKKVQFDEPVNIIFTSGTTGKPKGATLSHFNLVNNSLLGGRRVGYFEKTHRLCVPLPLFHLFGSYALVSGLVCGASVIYPTPSFESSAVASAIHEERPTVMYGVPTMFNDILQLPNIKQLDFSSVETAVLGGTLCPEPFLKKVTEKFTASRCIVAYGATETSPAITAISPSDPPEKQAQTVGKILPHVEVKLVNQKNEVVPIGAVGELWTRGSMVMLGYWEEPEKTQEAITPDRWYRTGDLATIDEDGYVKIVGRTKDMIIRGGENVYAKEIEELLLTHGKIADVYVVGVPDERMGEEICACVKLNNGETSSEENIKEFCKGKLAKFKIPRYVVFFQEFEKTPTGKVQKFRLQEECAKKFNR